MEQHITTKTQVMTGVTSTASSSCFSGSSSRLCFMYLLEKHRWVTRTPGWLAQSPGPRATETGRDGQRQLICWPVHPLQTHSLCVTSAPPMGERDLPLRPHILVQELKVPKDKTPEGGPWSHEGTESCEMPLSTAGTTHRPHLLSVALAREGLGSDPSARPEPRGAGPRGPLARSPRYS